MLRRNFLLSGSAFLTLLLTEQNVAAAETVKDAVAELKRNLPYVFRSGGLAFAPPDYIEKFRRDEFPARRTFLERLQDKSAAELGLEKPNPEARPYLDLFASLDVPLAPSPSEIRRIDVPVVPQPAQETLQDVVIDILIQAMELDALKDVLLIICEEYEPIKNLVDEIGKAVRMQDPKRLVDLLVLIVQLLLGDELRAFLARRLGDETARSVLVQVTRSLGKKLLPFIGWLITVYSFGVVIARNSERLRRAVGG